MIRSDSISPVIINMLFNTNFNEEQSDSLQETQNLLQSLLSRVRQQVESKKDPKQQISEHVKTSQKYIVKECPNDETHLLTSEEGVLSKNDIEIYSPILTSSIEKRLLKSRLKAMMIPNKEKFAKSSLRIDQISRLEENSSIDFLLSENQDKHPTLSKQSKELKDSGTQALIQKLVAENEALKKKVQIFQRRQFLENTYFEEVEYLKKVSYLQNQEIMKLRRMLRVTNQNQKENHDLYRQSCLSAPGDEALKLSKVENQSLRAQIPKFESIFDEILSSAQIKIKNRVSTCDGCKFDQLNRYSSSHHVSVQRKDKKRAKTLANDQKTIKKKSKKAVGHQESCCFLQEEGCQIAQKDRNQDTLEKIELKSNLVMRPKKLNNVKIEYQKQTKKPLNSQQKKR